MSTTKITDYMNIFQCDLEERADIIYTHNTYICVNNIWNKDRARIYNIKAQVLRNKETGKYNSVYIYNCRSDELDY